jgi:hypothetical protein
MKLQFQEHDLKFRTSNGQYKYFICSKCNLRVGAKYSSTDSCVSCRNSQLNQPCRTAEVVPVVDTTTAAGIATVAVVQLCAVCRTSECMYACVPCMHKCACRSCASHLRSCPICRQSVNHWKQIFESGIQGSAEDIVAKEELIGPVQFPVAPARARDVFAVTSDSSSSDSEDVEYLEPSIIRSQQYPLQRVIRVQRPQPSDHEWATSDTRRVYPESWCLAALAANGGDRVTAFDLLQSNALLLRFRPFDYSCKKFIEMGFQERHAQICLLLNNGNESQALEELLRGNWANT